METAKKFYFFIFLFALSLFFVSGKALAANSDIVINEIGAYEASGHEWVEIYNKGNESVDLTGWKFWENSTNHGLSVVSGDATVAPGEYAVIVQDATKFLPEHANVVGSVFDSSWSSLREDPGEEIGLKDAGENFVEQFTYIPAPNFSLERKNPALADYTAGNWQEHQSGNTVGATNSNVGSSPTTPANNPPVADNYQTPIMPPSPETNAITDAALWQKIKINEFLPDPAEGNEWVELYNTGATALDLTSGLICDERNATTTCKEIKGVIAGGGYLLVDTGARFLNNDGDSIIFKNNFGGTVGTVIYNEDEMELPKKGESLARKMDGAAEWVVALKPTPGAANDIKTLKQESIKATTEGNVMMTQDSSTSTLQHVSTSTVTKIIGSENIEPAVVENIKLSDATEDGKNKSGATGPATAAAGQAHTARSGLARLRELSKGVWVKTRGLVAVTPGIFGVQYFYITDSASGIQIYQNKKDFPPLKIGDAVEITGYISEARGEKRINVKNKEAVDILSTENFVSSTFYDISELGEESLGSLVAVSGEITEIKTNYMYVDDGESEVEVYFKRGAGIDKQKFKEGEMVEIIGVLENGARGLQIWPRSPDDIKNLGLSEDVLKEQATLEEAGKTGRLEKYLTASVGGFSVLLLAFLARARGVLVAAGIKKAVGLVVRIIKKG